MSAAIARQLVLMHVSAAEARKLPDGLLDCAWHGGQSFTEL